MREVEDKLCEEFVECDRDAIRIIISSFDEVKMENIEEYRELIKV